MVFLEVNRSQVGRPLVERTLSSTGDTALRHVIFVIIESGMALFVVQLVRTIVGNLYVTPGTEYSNITAAFFIVSGVNEMFNVIIRSIHFYFFFFY